MAWTYNDGATTGADMDVNTATDTDTDGAEAGSNPGELEALLAQITAYARDTIILANSGRISQVTLQECAHRWGLLEIVETEDGLTLDYTRWFALLMAGAPESEPDEEAEAEETADAAAGA